MLRAPPEGPLGEATGFGDQSCSADGGGYREGALGWGVLFPAGSGHEQWPWMLRPTPKHGDLWAGEETLQVKAGSSLGQHVRGRGAASFCG